MKGVRARILAVFMLMPMPVLAAEQVMGRLFFTPEQRAGMDVARQDRVSATANVTLNGVIVRNDGKTTVWINNQKQGGAVVAPGEMHGQVRLALPGAKRAVPLKVGQSLDMSSGRVEEAYRHNASPPYGELSPYPAN